MLYAGATFAERKATICSTGQNSEGQTLSRKKKKDSASRLLTEECFAAEDDRFLDSFLKCESPQYLASFVDKWLLDSRPWARDQILNYVSQPWNTVGHDVVYKRIFKHFFALQDHELMGVMMCELDRMVRRGRVKRWHYNYKTRESWTTERLYAATNKTHRWFKSNSFRQFSHRTRNYLRRAAWRYFRVLSHQTPEVYVREIAKALARYEDRDFAVGENILDNWSLMHACFYHDDSIRFTASHTNLAEGGSIDNLSPAPYQPEAWQTDDAADSLLGLLTGANSSLVRIWAIDFYLKHHQQHVGQIPLPALIEMMASPDVRLQDFAVEAFENHPDLPKLSVEQWLQLLDKSGVGQLPRLCDAIKKHVAEERLETAQLMELTCARQVPVAMLGFEYLQARDQKQSLSAAELSRLSSCQCAQQAAAITAWALPRISDRDAEGLPDHVIDFFDSLIKPARSAAMEWISDPESPGYQRAKLWAMLVETPFDDVKLAMVDLLHRRASKPDCETQRWAAVWVAVILGVNRGGRTKPKALDQLAGEIIRDPQAASELLPVLAVAIRSIRDTEVRHGLAALAKILEARPDLGDQISKSLPELELSPAESL